MQKGDKVRFLNSVGGGTIKKIDGNIAYVEEDDGFETPVLIRELIAVGSGDKAVKQEKIPIPNKDISQDKHEEKAVKAPAFINSPLNLVLAYNPQDVRHLNLTTFDTYLINDSEYYLFVVYMTRGDEQQGWTARYSGMIEPQTQEWLHDFTVQDLNDLHRVSLQYIAFSRESEFAMKSPATVELRLDLTKFFKLHCFRDSEYFDTPVLEIELVKNDMLKKPSSLQALAAIDKPIELPRAKSKKIDKKKLNEPLVVDLHASELLDTTAGMTTREILNYQIDHFRNIMDKNLREKGKKIVFIHGKGEGVLRNALMKELKHRYKTCEVQDASFREYGFGASQVTIR